MSAQQPEPQAPTAYDREVERVAREILKVRKSAQKKTYWAKTGSHKGALRSKEATPTRRGK